MVASANERGRPDLQTHRRGATVPRFSRGAKRCLLLATEHKDIEDTRGCRGYDPPAETSRGGSESVGDSHLPPSFTENKSPAAGVGTKGSGVRTKGSGGGARATVLTPERHRESAAIRGDIPETSIADDDDDDVSKPVSTSDSRGASTSDKNSGVNGSSFRTASSQMGVSRPNAEQQKRPRAETGSPHFRVAETLSRATVEGALQEIGTAKGSSEPPKIDLLVWHSPYFGRSSDFAALLSGLIDRETHLLVVEIGAREDGASITKYDPWSTLDDGIANTLSAGRDALEV